ncbi:UDP-N-acetyl-D-mannosamine dehydrogenase [Georgenia muralis]|uniref:UDP-N-acetyl-D-mannosaminuronic acid dehydrogenase n=1 Tax=Georgenia muralis TaxID=154117 RepID=A0A3N5A3H4_9MICO|nr:UDP-N-acetyl-D-mannosamine dehydrogenase [Georgenia muralis]RPF26361.1 UDP-N-acetyl-D-mannosaminuronic acid dehydrogenase [Georgenia muralis]
MDQSESVVAVIGLGYIGLPTAALLATHGVRVVGVDTDDGRVAAVNRGDLPFVEPELAEYLTRAVDAGNLIAQTQVPQASVHIIAVPTPFTADRKADLSFVDAAVDAVAQRLTGGELVILESTSPPGTTERIAERVARARPDLPSDGLGVVDFVHAPERVLPGRIMVELVENDRVIGGLSEDAAERAKWLYEHFSRGEFHLTTARTAEMVKLTENAYRDVNIAFANEMSVVAEQLGVNVWELIRLANRHPRVSILSPGAGVGGHCIAVDPWFIAEAAPELTPLIRAARGVNDRKPKWVAERIVGLLGPRPGKIQVLGLTYKKDVDDLRQSPAVEVVERLAANDLVSSVVVTDPHVTKMPESLAGHSRVELSTTLAVADDADVLAVLVPHTAFEPMLEAFGSSSVLQRSVFYAERTRG